MSDPAAPPGPPVARVAAFGTQRTDIDSTIARCHSPTAHVTRMDLQTNLARSFGRPYVSGVRLTCSDRHPVPALNWVDRDGTTADGANTLTTYIGADMPQGVRNLVVSHGKYINLVAYGDQTLAGNAVLEAGAKVWQQAALPEYQACVVVGVEATHMHWLDGAKIHFACPAVAPQVPGNATNAGSSTSGTTTSKGEGGFSAVWFASGLGVGLGVLMVAMAAFVVLQRRQARKDRGQSSARAQLPDDWEVTGAMLQHQLLHKQSPMVFGGAPNAHTSAGTPIMVTAANNNGSQTPWSAVVAQQGAAGPQREVNVAHGPAETLMLPQPHVHADPPASSQGVTRV